MYAILQQGGHQYRVAPGDRLVVDRLEAEVGSLIALEPVLLVSGEAGATVGAPVVEGARIAALVVAHSQGKKLRVFKYKPKKRYRRTIGHRSQLTELRIEALLAAGEPLPEVAPAVVEDAGPEAEPSRPARRRAAATAAAPAAPKTEAPEAEAPEAEAPEAEAATPSRRRGRAATPVAEVEATAEEVAAPAIAAEAEAKTPAPRRARRTSKAAADDTAATEE
jgi:large subunit ribosomal protein L21